MADKENVNYGYGKTSLWKWVLIYLVIGLIIYGIIYYFIFARKGGGYNYNSGSTQQIPSASQQGNPTVSAPTAKNSIQISNFAFSPTTLTVKVGNTVTWTNQDSMDHSATADDGSFDTGLLAQSKSGTVTFKKSGTYTYHCSIHPNMHGTIIVQ